jgi:hypothetical protein
MLQNEPVKEIADLALICYKGWAEVLRERLLQGTIKAGTLTKLQEIALQIPAALNKVLVDRHLNSHHHDVCL